MSSPASPASSLASSSKSTMLSFARALGMGKNSPATPAAAAPPPLDLPNPATPAADTSGVFYINDELSEIARVKQYSLSQLPLQRLVYVKRISACARVVGLKEAMTQLLPLFPKLAADHEAVVRTAASGELANLAHFLADPNVPYQPNSLAFSLATNLPSKPPSTAQTPDLTLEDDQLVDFELNDVSNVLPATLPSSAAAAAAAADAAAVASETGAAAASSSAASAATPSSSGVEAMDVDTAMSASPPSAASSISKAEADSSQPMDDVHESEEESTESTVSAPGGPNGVAAAATEDKQEEKTAERAASPVPVAAAAAASSSSPTAQSAATPSSPPAASLPAPLNVPSPTLPAASASSSFASASSSSSSLSATVHSPLSDPTSAIRLESYEQIKEIVIPCLQTLILDSNAEVRAAACDALVRVADVLRGDDVGKVVLTLVLNLAHDERDEQRTTAVHLMHELAPRLGHDLCRSFVALELAAFADDSTFRVRKATAQSFGNVAEIVGEQFTVNKLLPCYVRLSKDLIWGVRQSCAKSLVAVTRVVGLQTRTEVMIPMFERFAKDSSRWVRNGAYEILGPFLYALGPTLVSRELLAFFSGIPGMSSAIVDQEVNYHAAFNLPAVLTTVGAGRWDELQACFAALVKDTKFPVRRTLAYSLHELAAILGPALTEQSLLPALDTFLRDLDEVRYGVLKNFALIMRAITPAKRIAYLEVIWMVQKQNENWRWRLLWSKQLGAFAKLFDAEHTVTDIMPLSFALCKDQVAAVRRTAALALGRLLVRILSFSNPKTVLASCLNDIHAFAASITFMDRQLYLRMMEGVVMLDGRLPGNVVDQFLTRALTLASDKTSNVRLALAHTCRILLSHAHSHQSPIVREIVQRLSADEHAEVRRTITEVVQSTATLAITSGLATLDLSKPDTGAAAAAAAASGSQSTALTDADLDDILAGPSSVPTPATAASSATAVSPALSASSAPSSPLTSHLAAPSSPAQSSLQAPASPLASAHVPVPSPVHAAAAAPALSSPASAAAAAAVESDPEPIDIVTDMSPPDASDHSLQDAQHDDAHQIDADEPEDIADEQILAAAGSHE